MGVTARFGLVTALAAGVLAPAGCGGRPDASAPRGATDPSGGAEVASAREVISFAVPVPIGEGETTHLYVVLDETRGAGDAAAGEPITLGDDGVLAASTRGVDPSRLQPELRELAASRFVAIDGPCAGTLGPLVEITLRDALSGEDELLASVLAAPFEPACEEPATAVHVEGAPPARVYVVDRHAELDEGPARAGVIAAVRALPAYAAHQAEWIEENEEAGEAPWDEALGYEPQLEILRDQQGRELVRVRLGGPGRSLTALVERVGRAWVSRSVGQSLLVLDVEGDGILETVDRLGLSRDGVRLRAFTRAPFVLGC